MEGKRRRSDGGKQVTQIYIVKCYIGFCTPRHREMKKKKKKLCVPPMTITMMMGGNLPVQPQARCTPNNERVGTLSTQACPQVPSAMTTMGVIPLISSEPHAPLTA